jgi:hypothetical protein
MKSTVKIALMSLAVLSIGVALPIAKAASQSQNSPARTSLAKTWISIAGHAARPKECASSADASQSPGIWSLTFANGQPVARFIEIEPVSAMDSLSELSVYLTADVVLADGRIDPAFGAKPRDMIIAANDEGRVTVRFVDFTLGEFNPDQ